MKVKLGLWVEVPSLEAHFLFYPDAEREAQLAKWFAENSGDDGALTLDTDATPPEFAGIVEALFVNAVRQWQGVTGEDGRDLRCDAETRAAVDTADKITAVIAYFERLGALNTKGDSGDAPPMPPTAEGGE